MKKPFASLLLATAIAAAGVHSMAHAQSEASVALSMLPVASVVGTVASAVGAAGALSAAPLLLSAGAAVLTVKSVELSARGTVYVLERASDGARFSVEVLGKGASAVALGVGSAVAVSAIGTGLLLSAAGEVLAFIPNELGRALLYNERVTF